jgi:hypothetical protein
LAVALIYNWWSLFVRLCDALAKLLVEKGLITQDESMRKVSSERATN